MTNRFQAAADRLGQRLKALAGLEVVYLRKGLEEIPLTAWASVVSYEVVQGNVLTLVKSHDWGILAADLAVGDTRLTPEDGDRIRETIDGQVATYTVSPMSPRPSCEWQDSAGVMLLVHTKRTG